MRATLQDLLHALRVLRRSPRLAAAAVVILALGVAASATAFALVDAVLAPHAPYRDATRMTILLSTKTTLTRRNGGDGDFPADVAAVQAARSVFARTTYEYSKPGLVTTVTGALGPRLAITTLVPLDFFHVIGMRPLLGRLPPASNAFSPPSEAVISSHFWKTAFGARRSAIGRQVQINRRLYTAAAVIPKGVSEADIFLPVPHPGLGADPTLHDTLILAWLQKGVSLRQAQAALNVIAGRVATKYPKARGWKLIAVPYARFGVTSDQTTTLFFLLGAAILVLLASCLNVGALLLGRGLARSHEILILSALGAPPGRVARQLILEGLVLGAVGGAFGLLGAAWFLKLLHPAVVLWLPTLEGLPFSLDLEICLFAVCAAAAAGALCGLIPALGLLRFNATSTATGIGSLAHASPRHTHRLSLASSPFRSPRQWRCWPRLFSSSAATIASPT